MQTDPRPVGDYQQIDFSVVYRENVALVRRFFGSRCAEPEVVADLTAQTFVQAVEYAASFAGRGSIRSWLFAIARNVYAGHCRSLAEGRSLVDCLSSDFEPSDDHLDDLADRLDTQRRGHELMSRVARLSELDRQVIELVDVLELTPKEAADVLGVSSGSVRIRLFRAHTRLRKEANHDEL
jgi:RNA polymerase sigma-70 factor (ECF subfamily)